MNKKVLLAIRIILGLFMVFSGVMKFLYIVSPQMETDTDAVQLMSLLANSGFMLIIGVLEAAGGILLLVGKYVPLAITVLVAIMFNAFLFHLLFDPANIAGACLGLGLCLLLVWGYKERFKDLLSA